MTAHKPHAAMKDSGVAWLGKVPAHWDVVQSRRLFSERNQSAFAGEAQLTVSQKYGLLPQAEFMELEGRRIVQVQKGHDILKHVESGDFVISMRSFQGGLEYSTHTGSVSSAYVALTPIKWVEPRFYRHLFKSVTYIQALQSTSDLVRDGQALRFENFSKVALPVVPHVEQIAIADHLDRETARIDKLIARKTRFIELLTEKRKAFITHTVKKGLNPKAKTKDSGVEWLGRIPAHWDAKRFKFSVISSQNGIWGDEPNGVDDIACVRVADFDRAALAVCKEIPTLRAIQSKERRGRLLRNGNLLLEKSGGGEKQPVGQVVLFDSDVDAVCSNFIAKVELGKGMEPRFWNYQHHAAYCYRLNIKSVKQTSGIQNLDQQQYLDELAAYPPFNEQKEIADEIDKRTLRIDALMAKTERSIELLREHRIALITAAVTGKIDLRDQA